MQATPEVVTVDFEAGSLTSGGLTFTASESVGGQPVAYAATGDSRNPNGGGSYLFRTDFQGTVKRGDTWTGMYRSSKFVLAPGDITVDYAGNGGYIALCLDTNCKKKRPGITSTTLQQDIAFGASDLAPWVGSAVHFELADDQTGGWGHIAIDNIVFNKVPEVQSSINIYMCAL